MAANRKCALGENEAYQLRFRRKRALGENETYQRRFRREFDAQPWRTRDAFAVKSQSNPEVTTLRIASAS